MAKQLKNDRRKRKPKAEEETKAEAGSGRCPECGSSNVMSAEREVGSVLPWPLSLLVIWLTPRGETYRRCQYCGHEW